MKTVEVLMVEDNRGDVVLVQAAIEKAGLPYRVTVVSDGMEALEFLRHSGKHAAAPRPDLVLLDLKLPRKNGSEVLDEIRPDPLLADIPLVLLSSSKSELAKARTGGMPPECCLEKPGTYQGYVELLRAIEVFRCAAVENANRED